MADVTTSFLEKEYALSPVPVIECSQLEWQELCKDRGIEFGGGYGGYYFDMKLPKMPQSIIFVDSILPLYKRLTVFYHELTHAECRIKRCPCFLEDSEKMGFCEHHAQFGAIIKCIKSGCQDALDFAISATEKILSEEKDDEPYWGAFMTVNHPFWEYCKMFNGHDCHTVSLTV